MSKLAYVLSHNASVYRSHESRRAGDTCAYFLPYLKADNKVLDAGCGPGTVTSSLAALIPQGSVIGVDAVESVIERARAQSSLPPNCSFDTADLTSLPFEDDQFDVVYTSQVLTHIPTAVKALAELRRVCKPGGFVACREGDLLAVMLHPPIAALEQWKNCMIDVMLKSECHPSAGRNLLGWALKAGFTASKITYTVGAIKYTGSERKFWADMMAERLLADQTWYEKVMNLGLATNADIAAMRDGWAAFTEDDASVYVMPCGEVICYK